MVDPAICFHSISAELRHGHETIPSNGVLLLADDLIHYPNQGATSLAPKRCSAALKIHSPEPSFPFDLGATNNHVEQGLFHVKHERIRTKLVRNLTVLLQTGRN